MKVGAFRSSGPVCPTDRLDLAERSNQGCPKLSPCEGCSPLAWVDSLPHLVVLAQNHPIRAARVRRNRAVLYVVFPIHLQVLFRAPPFKQSSKA
jgi:hypothetical protein